MDGLASAYAAEAAQASFDMAFAFTDLRSLQSRNDVQDSFDMPMDSLKDLPAAYGRAAAQEALEWGLAKADATELLQRADGLAPATRGAPQKVTCMEGLGGAYAAEALQAAEAAKLAFADMTQLQARVDNMAMDTGCAGDSLPEAYRCGAAADVLQANLAQADAQALLGRYDSQADDAMGMAEDVLPMPQQSEEEAEAYDFFDSAANPQVRPRSLACSADFMKPGLGADLAKPGSGFIRQISDASTAPSEILP